MCRERLASVMTHGMVMARAMGNGRVRHLLGRITGRVMGNGRVRHLMGRITGNVSGHSGVQFQWAYVLQQ